MKKFCVRLSTVRILIFLSVTQLLNYAVMKKRNYKEMSNSELKLQIERLRNIFESKKNMLKNICEEMGEVEKEYLDATHELKIRKNILF